MKERILQIIQDMELTAAGFASEIHVQASSISHIISGRNKPSLDLLQKILSRYPRISSDWLMLGKGAMYRDEEDTAREKTGITEGLFQEEKAVPHASGHSARDRTPDGPESEQSPVYETKKRIERILVFYSDNSFKEYLPQ